MAVAALRKVAALPALGWWLLAVAAIRLGLAWSGLGCLRASAYSDTHVTDVHARTFGVLALLASTLCFLCAFNLENKPLYIATFLSTVYAYGHYIVEYLVYRTVSAANLVKLGVIAVTSMVWMLVHWRSAHAQRTAKQS